MQSSIGGGRFSRATSSRNRRSDGYDILRLPETSPMPGLLRRLALAVALVLLVTLLLWVTRDGLRDHAHPGRPLNIVDVFYFTVVSLATVGYGDISPVSATARLLNALLLTPIRVFVWVIFLGTAYELIFQRYREQVQMKQLKNRLRGHTIICGFGVKGRAIVDEMMAHGHALEQIVVIEPDEVAARDATSMGLVALRGDASSESMLHAAAIEEATHLVVALNRDDASVLVCLTVRSLMPHIRLIAAAREEENVKLLYNAGADVVVATSVSSGRLMGSAVWQRAVSGFLQDLLTFGEGQEVAERRVEVEEAGQRVKDLPDLNNSLILGVARGNERFPFHRLDQLSLQEDDLIVYVSHSEEPTQSTSSNS